MDESIQAILEKLVVLPEEKLTMILEEIAKSLWVDITDELENKDTEEKMPNEEQAVIGEEKIDPEKEEINPKDLVAKIAF